MCIRDSYNSIRKFIVFQLTINVSAVLISFMAPLLGMANPLSIVQILWVNLVMDTLAALAFGGEPALRRYMQERPKQRRESIVSREMWSAIVVDGLWAFGMSLFFLLSPAVEKFFRPAAGDAYLMTGYFAFYILMAVCNAVKMCIRARSPEGASGRVLSLVVGVGINVSQTEADFGELAQSATSIELSTGRAVRRAALAAAVIRALREMECALHSEGTARYIDRYRADCNTVGKAVTVITPRGCRAARALAVTDRAELLVEYEDGSRERCV